MLLMLMIAKVVNILAKSNGCPPRLFGVLAAPFLVAQEQKNPPQDSIR
jgi:hypothetical protein